ncbi:hypothetical protein [uncultured Treponema sp.]|uniref:hypothetical protein n=1 Tax=uncultured Treponema sp. TaxID=162155 RepID=UPI0025E73E33|nr:hypothetical protein [uncultured Treponema sp.]
MIRKSLPIALFSLSLLFTSCLPQISVKAGNGDEATIFFSTGFSDLTAKTLQTLTGADPNAPLFNKDDVIAVLNSAGAKNTSASLPKPTEIAATGLLPSLSEHQISMAGLVTKTEKSLTVTIGPKQITTFYDFLSEDAKSYLDLMMIPALLGEKMTAAEYRELLASMYGPTFADEIVEGKLTINLSSPDGKRKLKETVTLGELLTAEKEYSWKIDF